MNLKKKIITGLTALALGVGGFTIAPTVAADPGTLAGPPAAEAASSGCVSGTVYWRFSHTNWYGLPVYYEYCTYRTSLGVYLYGYKTGAWYVGQYKWFRV